MDIRHFACTVLLLAWPALAGEPKPTHRDVRYSKEFDRSVLDFWQPTGGTSAPVIVYFHGGAFKAGDKSHFYKHPILLENYSNGVAFASVNYPFLNATNYLGILAHTVESITFLKSKSRDWGLASDKMAVMGLSAGAMIAEYLTYWNNLGIRACFAEEQPYNSSLLLINVKKNDPPLILYTRSGAKDEVHNPSNARLFKDRFDAIGVKCELYGSEASGLPRLPAGTTITRLVMEVFRTEWDRSAPATQPHK